MEIELNGSLSNLIDALRKIYDEHGELQVITDSGQFITSAYTKADQPGELLLETD